MKQIIFAAILTFAFCLAFSAQTETEKSRCPVIKVSGDKGAWMPDEPILFTGHIDKDFDVSNNEYFWTVEGGKILDGQGTKSISALMDECGHIMKATLEIKGLPQSCPKTASETYFVSHNCELMNNFQIYEYGNISFEEEKIKIDNLIDHLNGKFKKWDYSEGAFILPNDKNLIRRLKLIDNYLTLKKFDKSRITYAIERSPYRKETSLWVVSRLDEFPDCADCLIIKADDKEGLGKLFNKNEGK